MDCRRYRNALSDAAAGPIEAEQQCALDEHLTNCPACAARLERLKRAIAEIDRAVAESAEMEPSPELLREFERRLAAEPRRASLHLSVRTMAAAAAVLVLVAGAWLLRGQFFSPVPVPRRVAPPFRAAAVEPGAQRMAGKLVTRVPTVHVQPLLSATARPRPRLVHGETHATNRAFFERVKVVPGEQAAIIQLYALLRSGKVKPQVLFPPGRDLDKPLKIAPLRIKPISIVPIEISRISDASHDPTPDSARSTVSRTDTNKETTP